MEVGGRKSEVGSEKSNHIELSKNKKIRAEKNVNRLPMSTYQADIQSTDASSNEISALIEHVDNISEYITRCEKV